MLETPDKVNYKKWDSPDFTIPDDLRLGNNSCLHEAISVFYKAGGYDFFKVIDPEKYAGNWLDFIGGLYSDIVEGKYIPDGNFHKNPLSADKIASIKEQGVPEIFTADIK